MVKRTASKHSDGNERKKRIKYATYISSAFVNPEDIPRALDSLEASILTQGLAQLRNQLTVHASEGVLSPQDQRLLLVKGWFDISPGARDIFSILDRIPQTTPSVISLCLAVISSVLKILSAQYVYHSYGEPIMKKLLSHPLMSKLNGNISSDNHELIQSTLEVFNAMSTYAGGAYQRSIMDGFSWGQKSVQKLLFLRTRGKNVDPISKPDIRTLFLLFILSFLSNSTPTPVKLLLLEQHRDVFLPMFKVISQDPYPVVRRILETCWEGLWNDVKIKRTLKIGLFNEQTINYLLKLYTRDTPEDETQDHAPADLVHHFMLSLTTRPGVGICFKDRGWYPKEQSSEEGILLDIDAGGDESSAPLGGKLHNKILANVVKSLKVNEDPRQQELTFRILEACPELVAGYWNAVNLTLEPRLSSRWITNIAILGAVISFPIPTTSFLLPHSTQHNPSPPPLTSALANILPPVLTKNHLTKGLQSGSKLVQHCTAVALSKCLIKLDYVLAAFRKSASHLEENEETGQWSKRWRELVKEVEKRVPDFMVIVAMVHKYQDRSNEQDSGTMLLAESSLRILWLYHKMFPRLIAEAKFDIGKLLLRTVKQVYDSGGGETGADDGASVREDQSGMEILRQLHVLRLLKDSEQFSWSSKSGLSSHSYLHAILVLYTKTLSVAVRTATSDLLAHLLARSILFSHDPAEIFLWLDALPLTRRSPRATTLDGTPLLDETTSVLNFLDECIQRCSKTPYRYLEECRSFFSTAVGEDSSVDNALFEQSHQSIASSPLLMTLLEQLRAKVNAGLMLPANILAVVTFMRKLTYILTRKGSDLQHARKLQRTLEEICSLLTVSQSAQFIHAIRRECNLLSNVLDFIEDPVVQAPVSSCSDVQQYLEQIERLQTLSIDARMISATEIVDWMRLNHSVLCRQDVKRLLHVVLRFSPFLVKEFFFQLDPQHGNLWYSIEDNPAELKSLLSFEFAYLHATPSEVAQSFTQEYLVSLFFLDGGRSEPFGQQLSIVMQRLAARLRRNEKLVSHPEFPLLTSILKLSRSRCTESEATLLKKFIFLESSPVRGLCCSPDVTNTILQDISMLVHAGLDPNSASDKILALDYCASWIAYSRRVCGLRPCALASPWIQFMDVADIMMYLDRVISAAQVGEELSDVKHVAKCVLEALSRFRITPGLSRDLQHRWRGLLDLRPHLDESSALDKILLLVVESGLPLGYNALSCPPQQALTVSDVSLISHGLWKNRATGLTSNSDHIIEFLHSEKWTETIARIVSGTLYQSSTARHAFYTWLSQREPYTGRLLGILSTPLYAFLDIISLQSEKSPHSVLQLPDSWFLALVRHLLRGQDSTKALACSASCIYAAVKTTPSRRAFYANELSNAMRVGTEVTFNVPSSLLIRDLHQLDSETFASVLGDFSDLGLSWMVNRLSDDLHSDANLAVMETLARAISHRNVKVHLLEPVLKAAIQTCLDLPEIIQALIPLVISTPLKPVLVNRVLQSVVQHKQLYRLAEASVSTRTPIIRLLHTLFHLHATNTCQPSHVVPLARLYGGTLSLSDRLLFSIFYLYENQRNEPATSIFCHLSFSGSSTQDVLGIILGLDSSKVFRACTTFPTRRSFVAIAEETGNIEGEEGYDPIFLTLIVVQLVAEPKRLSATEWVQVFRSNVVCVVMRALTSRDEFLRDIGVTTLAGLMRKVQEADFFEKNQVVYIIDMLRDLLPPPSTPPAPSPRLPIFPVMVLAYALRSIFYPSSFLYPIISRFLLQRPEFDITDVPMLYSLLYSSSDGGEWTRERTWIIRLLTDSVREGSAREWSVLRRRHTWDLVASMWQAARKDERSLRRGILELLANLSANPHAITPLILRSTLLSWMEMQLQTQNVHDVENFAFVKILENILVIANIEKVNKAMRGEFTEAISRCLQMILRDFKLSEKSTPLALLSLIARIVLRVVSHPSSNACGLQEVVVLSTEVLQKIESSIAWKNPPEDFLCPESAVLPNPPHYSQGLFDLPLEDSMEGWSECVRSLWRVTMSLGAGQKVQECWDILSCRLLLSHTSGICRMGGKGNTEEVWARRQIVEILLEQKE